MKTTLHFIYRSLNVLLAMLLAVASLGCDTIQDHSLTHSLWTDTRSTSHCRPAADPDLKLFLAVNSLDVLVEYSALSDRFAGVQRRAYFLEANRKRIAAGESPRFVACRQAVGLRPIPVLMCWPPAEPRTATNGDYAVFWNGTFELHRPECSPEACPLPHYQDGAVGGSWKRALLVPFCVVVDVAVDVTVVGVVAGFAAAYAYCSGSAPETGWRSSQDKPAN